jgi:hypothetical protein
MSCYYTIVNRAAVLEQIRTTRETLSKLLLALLESSEADKLLTHLYGGAKAVQISVRATKQGNKAIERNVIAS